MKGYNSSLKIFFPLLSIILYSSCSAILSSPLEVVSWSPAKNLSSPSEINEITILFNREPEPVRTEEAFSLTAAGIEPPGKILIEGTVLTFTPYYPLTNNTDYEIKLTTSAEDENGNSLIEDFQFRFRIGANGGRPGISATEPGDGENISDLQTPIVLTFYNPVILVSVLSAFSISPSVDGVSILSPDGKNFTFTPAEKWEWQQEYKIRISTDLKSTAGYSLAEEYSFSFTAGTDQIPPVINTATSEDGSITLIQSPAYGASIEINTGWEKDESIRFVFSEEVDQSSAASAVTVEPDATFEVKFDDSANPAEMVIRFKDNLLWHELYMITLSTALGDLQNNNLEEEYIYYIFIDGPSSLPPAIDRVEFSEGGGTGFCIYNAETPAAAVTSHNILDTSGGDASANPYFVDYYFSLADGAELPFFGLVENFLISPAESCISVSYLDFQIWDPGDSLASAASPVPTPDADQGVVRLITSLTDNSGQSGQILLQVYSDLNDSLGNQMAEDWTAELFDEDS